MPDETVETLIIGGGQAGLAMSEQLSRRGLPHMIVERGRVAERWRSERWDSLHANGPAWHDRLPSLPIGGVDPDGFATHNQLAAYFEAYADHIAAPIRCGVTVSSLRSKPGGRGFIAETSAGVIEAANVVSATGPFQRPRIPAVIPPAAGVVQIHSSAYRCPDQLGHGAVLVVGAGASGSQIADELCRAGRRVYVSLGRHVRPPRRYRGRDCVWWLDVLGMWNASADQVEDPHETIAVSGAYGGHTIDFRELAARGATLLGRTSRYDDGVLRFSGDLAALLAEGDAAYLSFLDAADAYVTRTSLDLPEELAARQIPPDPACVTAPLIEMDLEQAGITHVVWATGYGLDYDWLHVEALDDSGAPMHRRGVTDVPGFYFLGLSWLSCRASNTIFGMSADADHLAAHIAGDR